MEITRKNYSLQYDEKEIKEFNFAYFDKRFSLRDFAVSIAEEINNNYQYKIDYDRNCNYFFYINNVRAFQLTTDNIETIFHYLNISRNTKKENVLIEVEKFSKAVKNAIQEMHDAAFEIEIVFIEKTK